MKYRFYDIMAENESGEYALNREFVLEIPDHDMSCVLERQEHTSCMFDAVVAASGCDIYSFSCDQI
jgi:hypothetical protein